MWSLIALAAVIAGASLALLLRFASWLPHARPGPRSLHDRPMPRVGGLAVWAGFLPAAVLAPPFVPGAWSVWMVAGSLIVGVSLIDDWRGVHPLYRLGS